MSACIGVKCIFRCRTNPSPSVEENQPLAMVPNNLFNVIGKRFKIENRRSAVGCIFEIGGRKKKNRDLERVLGSENMAMSTVPPKQVDKDWTRSSGIMLPVRRMPSGPVSLSKVSQE